MVSEIANLEQLRKSWSATTMEKRKRQKYVYDDSQKKEPVFVTVPEEIHKLIVSEAEEKNESLSKVVANIVEEFYSSWIVLL